MPYQQLKAMATDFPTDKQSLIRMFGDIQKTRENGEKFLYQILIYCKLNNIGQKINNERDYPPELREILELCIKCKNIEEIYIQKKDSTEREIIRIIEQLILSGADIPIDKFVNAKKQKEILEAISKVGCENISFIKRKLNEYYTEGDIRFVRANKIRKNK
ncbi:hypothetical protein METP3_00170 [Methanosarcinales archaeon]|nr:hypothetical protein METP3_00170 [Methanosarcinales archaeon]